jgi:hypothetical protein
VETDPRLWVPPLPGCYIVFRILHLDLPRRIFIMSLYLWDWGVPPLPPPHFLLSSCSLVMCVHSPQKIISPKSLPNHTRWEKTNNNQSNNLCHRTQLFWLCVICSFLLHPCPQPPPGLASHVWWPHGWHMVGKWSVSHFKGKQQQFVSCKEVLFLLRASCVVWGGHGKHLETTVVASIPMH